MVGFMFMLMEGDRERREKGKGEGEHTTDRRSGSFFRSVCRSS